MPCSPVQVPDIRSARPTVRSENRLAASSSAGYYLTTGGVIAGELFLSSPLRLHALSLDNRDDLIHRRIRDLVRLTARPANFERALLRAAQTEVQAQIAL